MVMSPLLKLTFKFPTAQNTKYTITNIMITTLILLGLAASISPVR